MAEPFGIITGAVSIAAIFTTCVDCFGYIQLGRHFSRDFQTKFLMLECTKLRLSRWGEAVDISNDPNLQNSLSDAESIQLAKRTLVQILILLEDSKKIANEYAVPETDSENTAFDIGCNKDIAEQGRDTVLQKVRAITKSRKKRTGLVKKTTWALHEESELTSLIESATTLIEHLERLFPTRLRRGQLSTTEVAEMQKSSDLHSFYAASQTTDPLRRLSIRGELIGHHYANIKADHGARCVMGNHASSNWPGMQSGRSHIYDGIEMAGQCRVVLGNKFGGKDIFDDD